MTVSSTSSRDSRDARVRAAFRRAGRKVLHEPKALAPHRERVLAAIDLPGSEALQGALVDLLYACAPDPAALGALIASSEVAGRLAPHVLEALAACAAQGQRLPRVNRWATRWCVLATPSLDVPRRALLCGTDDSRAIAERTLAALREGNVEIEHEFLAHCEGTHDTLAFMLVRRDLTRRGIVPGPRWDQVAAALEGERK